MPQQLMVQHDLFEGSSEEGPRPQRWLADVVAQLTLLMQSVIDAIEWRCAMNKIRAEHLSAPRLCYRSSVDRGPSAA
ncbi:hypothetical protein B0G80_8987 [Paraburkholderia sp. BL6669N2]|nr:hypothetical protein B0G80_8987 [Paraburkholderia sp. BL6669N2]